MDEENKDKNSIGYYLFGFIIFGLMGLLIGSFFYGIMGSENVGSETVKEKTTIYSVDTQKDITGQFALGYGSIDTNVNYYVYVNDGNKGKILKHYNADKTHIMDTLEEGQDSYIETEYKVEYIVPANFHKDQLKNELVTYNGKKCYPKKTYLSDTLYLPKGYIKKQIDLNIK
jgi:hypothetical protein